MGEKAETEEVINRLTNALGDTNVDVRINACKAFCYMGRNVATNAVVVRLASALEDTDNSVRIHAYEALSRMGEKAETEEVINTLTNALGDTNVDFRISACKAFCKMGRNAATNAVVVRLTSALGDTDGSVRAFACKALGEMGEKVGTDEVIDALTSALSDTNVDVRINACKAFCKMDTNAATNVVVVRLTDALEDPDDSVRLHACKALNRMGEKAETEEVIKALMHAFYQNTYEIQKEIAHSIQQILVWVSSLSHLTDYTISKLWKFIEDYVRWDWTNIFPEKFVDAFLKTKILSWLPFIKEVSIRGQYGVTLSENSIVIYGSKEPVVLPFSDRELFEQLQAYFGSWLGDSLRVTDELSSVYTVQDQGLPIGTSTVVISEVTRFDSLSDFEKNNFSAAISTPTSRKKIFGHRLRFRKTPKLFCCLSSSEEKGFNKNST